MKGAEEEARGKSGRERAKITTQVRQLQGLTLGAVQAQVTEQSLHAKVSDPRMEVKKKKRILMVLWDVLPSFGT